MFPDIMNIDTIEGVTVYGDDKDFNKFYLMPEQPRFRVDNKGHPIFTFLKYRNPIHHPSGRVGGGFAVFDVEFTESPEQRRKIEEKLEERVRAEANRRGIRNAPPMQISTINYTRGTANLTMSDQNSTLIERINQAGKPSLYGKNISTYSIELTPEGATLFEQALQGKGGFVSIIYDLYFMAKLPPIQIRASFRASAFYSFFQTLDVDENMWGNPYNYQEYLHEYMHNSKAKEINIEWGGVTDEKVRQPIRDWVNRSVDDEAERMIIEALPVEDASEAMKLYKENDVEHIRRDITRHRINDFTLKYDESQTTEFNRAPQGTLPNITNLVDNENKPILWKDYAREVDLDDPFFKQLRVDAFVRADFQNLPINSVEVKLSYNGEPMDLPGDGPDGEYRFTTGDDVAHFASFIDEEVNQYQYSYQVNYRGEARSFNSPEHAIDWANGILEVGVDDMGILLVDIAPGDLNFAQVREAQLAMQYEDTANGIRLIENQFRINEDNPVHRFQEVIFVERSQPYKYRVKYFMQDGKEYELDWQEGQSQRLFINDPFKNTKRIGVRAAGDLEKEIETIFVDLKYDDEANKYTQETSIALSSRQPFFDWEFPVIDETAGVVSYSGNIVYQDGTIQEIPETVTESRTPIIGEAIRDRLTIMVLTDLIDFEGVKLIRLEMRYQDAANDISEREDFVFGGRRPTEATWRLKLADKTKTDYEWEATFFMADGSRLASGVVTADDLTLLLEVPA